MVYCRVTSQLQGWELGFPNSLVLSNPRTLLRDGAKHNVVAVRCQDKSQHLNDFLAKAKKLTRVALHKQKQPIRQFKLPRIWSMAVNRSIGQSVDG
eukprot:1176209-Prorocentrum_minimum.AAC.1